MKSFFQFFLEKTEVATLSEIPAKQLGLSNSMVRLPMSAPYGFWMDRHGNFMAVTGGIGSHEKAADAILKKAGINSLSVYDTLLYAGWVRILIKHGNLYYETYPGNLPTNIQKKNMSFMKEFYELSSIEQG